MRPRTMRRKVDHSWDTWVEVDEVELDVTVHYDVSPPEPDVGFGGDIGIESVIHNGDDITDKVQVDQENDLIERYTEYMNSYYDSEY